MARAKTRKIVLDGYGSYLKMDKGCFVVRKKEGREESYPALEMDLGEIILGEGMSLLQELWSTAVCGS